MKYTTVILESDKKEAMLTKQSPAVWAGENFAAVLNATRENAPIPVTQTFFPIHPKYAVPNPQLTRAEVYSDVCVFNNVGSLSSVFSLELAPVTIYKSCDAIPVAHDVMSLVHAGDVQCTDEVIFYYGKQDIVLNCSKTPIQSPALGAKITHFHLADDAPVTLMYSPETDLHYITLTDVKLSELTKTIKTTIDFLVSVPIKPVPALTLKADVQDLINCYASSTPADLTMYNDESLNKTGLEWLAKLTTWKKGISFYRVVGLVHALQSLKIEHRIISSGCHVYLEIRTADQKNYVSLNVNGQQQLTIDNGFQPSYFVSLPDQASFSMPRLSPIDNKKNLIILKDAPQEEKINTLLASGFVTEDFDGLDLDVPLSELRATLLQEQLQKLEAPGPFFDDQNADVTEPYMIQTKQYLTYFKACIFTRFYRLSFKHLNLEAPAGHAKIIIQQAFAHDAQVVLFEGEDTIRLWAKAPKADTKIQLLVLHDIDLNDAKYCFLQGIYDAQPKIILGGKPITLRSQHRIITLPSAAPSPKTHMNADAYLGQLKHLPEAVLIELCIKPVFAGMLLTDAQLQVLCAPIIAVYTHEKCQTFFSLSWSTLQFIAQLARHKHETNPQITLQNAIQYYSYQLTQWLFSEEQREHLSQLQAFKGYDASLFVKAHIIPNILRSYQPMGYVIEDIIAYRQWCITHHATLNNAQKNGHFILDQPQDADAWSILTNALESVKNDVCFLTSALLFADPKTSQTISDAIDAGKIICIRDIHTDPLKQQFCNEISQGFHPITNQPLPKGVTLLGTRLAGPVAKHQPSIQLPSYTPKDEVDMTYQRRLELLRRSFNLSDNQRISTAGQNVYTLLKALHFEGVDITRELIATEKAIKLNNKPVFDELALVASKAAGHTNSKMRKLGFALLVLSVALIAAAGVCFALPFVVPAAILIGTGVAGLLGTVGLLAESRATGLSKDLNTLHHELEKTPRPV